jgi:hypothetical protein
MFLLGMAGLILKWIVSPPFYKPVLQLSIDLHSLASGHEGAPCDGTARVFALRLIWQAWVAGTTPYQLAGVMIADRAGGAPLQAGKRPASFPDFGKDRAPGYSTPFASVGDSVRATRHSPHLR